MIPILDRHVIGACLVPTLVMMFGLLILYTGFAASVGLATVLVGEMELAQLGWYLLARDMIALEVLLPTASFLGIVVGLTRLHRDREAFAFYAAGVSRLRLLRGVCAFAVLLGVLAAVLSVQGRPWSYRQSDEILRQSTVSIEAMQPATFNRIDNQTVVYASRVEREARRLEEVFASRRQGAETRVLRSRSAQVLDDGVHRPRLEFVDGMEYRISQIDGADRIYRFERLSYAIEPPSSEVVEIRRKARPTAELAGSASPKDLAELQWRTSLPLVALLLPLIAMRLGFTAPGDSGYSRVWGALLVYLLVFALASLLRSSVENGHLAAIPGMYLLPAGIIAMYGVILLVDRVRSR